MSQIRRILLETLNQRGPLPVSELARAAHHSPLATRYHLGLLLADGLIIAEDVQRHAGAGRPQMLYTLADPAHEHLPKQYHRLAQELLDEIGDTLGEKEQRALLRRVGKRLANTAPALRRSARIETRLQRAANFLTENGYVARWEKIEGAYTLHVCNCPYRQVALEHRQVCEMDLALIAELIQTPMKLNDCIAHQNTQCSFTIKPNEPPTRK